MLVLKTFSSSVQLVLRLRERGAQPPQDLSDGAMQSQADRQGFPHLF